MTNEELLDKMVEMNQITKEELLDKMKQMQEGDEAFRAEMKEQLRIIKDINIPHIIEHLSRNKK